MKNKLMLGLSVVVLVLACNSDSRIEQEIAKIEVDFKVERFDKILANSTPNDLPKLKTDFPFLFSNRISDSIWISSLKDTLQQQLLSELDNKFANFEGVSNDIKSLFQHLKYYDKMFSVPRVITLTNDWDYRNKNIVTDTIVLIALNNYLGKDHEFYVDIPKYLAQNMEPSQIIPDLAEQYSQKYIFGNTVQLNQE